MRFRNSTKLTAILPIMSALLTACGNDAPVYTDTASSTESETEAPKNELALLLPDNRFDGHTVRYSYNVLTIMQDNKMFDFAYNFDSTGNSYNALATVIIGNQSTDFASYYVSIKDGINASFRNMFDEVMNG